MSEAWFAIGGVFLGGRLGWIGKYIRHRYTASQRAKYLAVRVIIALDRYVEKCAASLTEHDPDFPDDRNPDLNWNLPEKPTLPTDVDWTTLPVDLTYRVLEIPQRDAEAREAVIYAVDVADGDAGKNTMDEYFEKIALDAAACAIQLRSNYGLPQREYGDWNPEKIIKSYRKARLERLAQIKRNFNSGLQSKGNA